MSDVENIKVKPVNAHVWHPDRKAYLKQVEQELPRTPWLITQLRIGDVVKVETAPAKTEAAKPVASKTVAKKNTDSDSSSTAAAAKK